MTPASHLVPRPVAASVEATLAATPLFCDLDEADLAEVAGLAQPFELSSAELLFRQGERAEQLFVLEEGRMEVLARLPGDREMRLSEVGGGDILGELSLVLGGTRTASARAVEATRGLLISRDAFARLRTSLRPAGAVVMRSLCRLVCARLRARCETLGGATARVRQVEGPAGGRALEARDAAHMARLDFFAQFGSLLPELASRATRLDVERGTVLVAAGSRPDRFFVTLRGAVEATIELGATRQRLRLAGPGRAAAYLGLLDEGPSPVVCRARETAQLLVVSGAHFAALIGGGDRVGRAFVDAVTKDLVGYLTQAERRQATTLTFRST